MSTPDFAAAQARLAARRAARENALIQTTSSPSQVPAAILNLPPSLRILAQSGQQVWDTVRSPFGTRPAFRVGQVDAELLDEELLQLLRNQVGDALKYYGSHLSDDWSAEIVTALRLVLWKLSIWDRGTSYGGSLQGLRYVDARQGRGIGKSPDPSRVQKGLYGLLTVGGRYGWQKWEEWLSEREGGYEEPSTLVHRLGKISNLFSMTHEVAAFASFLVFLYNGKYRTLVDRLLRMRLAPASAQTSREVSFEYLNRQLVWHAFTEFLLFLLPLVGISRWRRWLSRAWGKAKGIFVRKSEDDDDAAGRGELGFLPERTCAICYRDQNTTTGSSEAEVLAASGGSGGVIGSVQTDITNPYEAIPCGCVYCFVCVAQRIEAEEGEGWTCLRCGEVVKECRPWTGDVVDETPSQSASDSKGTSRKSVVFADEEEADDEMVDMEPMPFEEEAEFIDGSRNHEEPALEENVDRWHSIEETDGTVEER